MRHKVLTLRSFKLSMNQKLSIFPAQFEHLTLNVFNCCESNSLSLNHGWLLNEKQQFTPLALQSRLSCRSVSVSYECCSSLKYLIFGTKLDRTKKSPYQLFFPTFLCLLLFNLAFVISTNKVKNTWCFLCLQFNVFVQNPGVQIFGHCYPADYSQSIGQALPKHTDLYSG